MKPNAKFCLDAFAWLAWLQDEPGAAAVQHCLDEAERGRAECVTSIINLGEAYYRLVRVERREEAESLWRASTPQLAAADLQHRGGEIHANHARGRQTLPTKFLRGLGVSVAP